MIKESCQNCESNRRIKVSAKSNDLNTLTLKEKTYQNLYLPSDMGIGGDDFVFFVYCLDCGQIQGKWPLPETNIEKLDRLSDDLGIK